MTPHEELEAWTGVLREEAEGLYRQADTVVDTLSGVIFILAHGKPEHILETLKVLKTPRK